MNDENRDRAIDSWGLLSLLGTAACASLVCSVAFMHWEWSFLMDDVAYLQWMPKVTNLGNSMAEQIRDYLHDGRFYPFKYLMNLLKWRYMPLQPDLFHWFNFAVLAAAVSTGVTAVLRRVNVSRPHAAFVFMLGLAVLQRPLLDVVALNSIGETWVILFFGIGLLFYPRRPIAYRLAFLLAALSKEPAIVAFGAAGFVRLVKRAKSRDEKKEIWVNAIFDIGLCLIYALILRKIQSNGTYLATYSLINANTVRLFLIGFVKCSLGLLPLVAFMNLNQRIFWRRLFDSIGEIPLLCVFFGLGYLFLATGRGVAGYLLIPVAFAFFLASGGFVLPVVDQMEIRPLRRWVIALTFLSMLVISLGRYERYCAAINEPARAFADLLLTRKPRLVIINGEEAVALGQLIANNVDAPIKVAIYRSDSESCDLIKTFRGDVILFELSAYFGRYSSDTVQNLGAAAGGWKRVINRKVCRIFYGQRPLI